MLHLVLGIASARPTDTNVHHIRHNHYQFSLGRNMRLFVINFHACGCFQYPVAKLNVHLHPLLYICLVSNTKVIVNVFERGYNPETPSNFWNNPKDSTIG